MEHLTVTGLVLREVNFGDSDRYITVLTERGVRIEVLCRGVRRRGGRLGNAVRLFCRSELTLFQGRGGKYTLSDAELLDSFWGVTESMERYALACYLAELTAAMTDEGEELPAASRLLLGALYALTRQNRPLGIVKPAFELRLMAESGYAPDLSACGVCGKPVAGGGFFSAREGALLDADCCRRLGGAGFVPVGSGVRAAMEHIVTCDLARVYAFSLGGASLETLGRVCEEYVLCHAERGFDSLNYYKKILM